MIQKFLFQPLKPWIVNQGFGENKVCIDLVTNEVISKDPFKDETPCPSGTKSVYSQMKGHNGIDANAYRWQPCYSCQEGWVEEKETEPSRGLGVGIITNKKFYCAETGQEEFFKIRYWHFIALNVDIGEKVNTGDLIGYCDSTGYSSGDHLHLEIKPVRQNKYGDWENILQSNGYFGAVDPAPYMENMFVLDFVSFWKKVKELLAILTDFLGDKLRR